MRFLIKHVGNLGDMIFLVPPLLSTLKTKFPGCRITFVTAWGFKDKRGRWGKRNQDGFCIAAMLRDPRVDELVHWDDTRSSLTGDICVEENRHLPTWNTQDWQHAKESGRYDGVFELDFGLTMNDNPVQKVYEAAGLSNETYSNYDLHFSPSDLEAARSAMRHAPRPRIVLLEGLAGSTTRGWDPAKTKILFSRIRETYGVPPFWFGSAFIPEHDGRPLNLRENIACLKYCDAGIGVLSGPLHMAAAVALPTITLYCDQPLHRATPAFFLNRYITDLRRHHRTILGPNIEPHTMLKSPVAPTCLTPAENAAQNYVSWYAPGRQSTKACLATITVDEVMRVLKDIL